MRTLKITALLALVIAFAATTAFAGPSCSASKQVKTVSSEKACISSVFAAAGNACSASKAKLAEMVEIESTRMPSGTLVVQYKGKTDDAIAYLQTSAAGSIENFCCPVTRSVASNDEADVEVMKTKTGAMVVVSSGKKEVIDEYATSLVALGN